MLTLDLAINLADTTAIEEPMVGRGFSINVGKIFVQHCDNFSNETLGVIIKYYQITMWLFKFIEKSRYKVGRTATTKQYSTWHI